MESDTITHKAKKCKKTQAKSIQNQTKAHHNQIAIVQFGKEKNFKDQERHGTYIRTKMRMTTDFMSETMQYSVQWIKILKETNKRSNLQTHSLPKLEFSL